MGKETAENGTPSGTKDFLDPANQRRFSTRKRKNVDALFSLDSSSGGVPRPQKKKQQQEIQREEEIEFPLNVGTEIIINGKIKENSSFTGEVLVVQGTNSNGIYKLEMANPCDGLWGNYILRSERSLLRNLYILKTPNDLTLIPIEFSLSNAVYDIRSPFKTQKLPVEDTLQGWRWVNSWERLTWTTQPLQVSYQHIFNLAKVAIVDNFTPLQGPPPLLL